jgi:hypothetical protein
MDRVKAFATVLLLAWPATGSSVAAAPLFEPEAICRTALASIKGRDPKSIKVALTRGDVFFLTYTRPIDSFVWTYRCRIEGSRVVWADEPGRWRNEPKDDKISFEAVDAGAGLQIIATHRNGQSEKQLFGRETILRSGAE